MKFKEWFQTESAKELARQYSQSLKPIPQDPKHHPEGDVLTHIKLVRKSIPQAISYLLQLKTKEPWNTILQDIDIVPDARQMEILKLSAWLHDIGKIPTTTITTDSGTRHWTEPGDTGKIRSLRHEDPQFYQPEIDKLSNITPPKIKKTYEENKSLFDFLIQRHMDVSKGGFPNEFVAEYFSVGIVAVGVAISLVAMLGIQPANAAGDVTLRMTMWSSNAGHLALFNGLAADFIKLNPEVKEITVLGSVQPSCGP